LLSVAIWGGIQEILQKCWPSHYFKAVGITDAKFGQIGLTEERIIKGDPSHLIVWRENNEMIGDAV
jgi:hypothetical protein